MKVEYARAEDAGRLRALWKACFPEEEDSFTEYFFTRLFRPSDALVCAQEGQIAAMLYMLPFALSLGGQVLSASYIYGVGTDPAYRNRGLSGTLMKRALWEMHQKNTAVAVLIPQQAWLFDFYTKFGFEPVFTIDKETEPLKASIADIPVRRAGIADISCLDALYEQAMGARAHIVRTPSHWENILEEARLSGGAVLMAGDAAYAVCSGDGTVAEAFGQSGEARDCVLHAAATDRNEVTVFAPGREDHAQPFGCARVVDAQACLLTLGGARDARVAVSDGLCPWNERTIGQDAAHTRFEWTQAELVRAVFSGILPGTDRRRLSAGIHEPDA